MNVTYLGWTNDLKSPPKTGHRPICIVAKRVFPCEHAYYTSDSITDIDADARDHPAVRMCATNYFFWDTEDCSVTHSHPYICERPLDDIGESAGKVTILCTWQIRWHLSSLSLLLPPDKFLAITDFLHVISSLSFTDHPTV